MTDYIDLIDINGIWFNEFPDDSSYQFMQINVVSFVEGLLSLLWPYEYKCIQVKRSLFYLNRMRLKNFPGDYWLWASQKLFDFDWRLTWKSGNILT
jgi:hypothetical protein